MTYGDKPSYVININKVCLKGVLRILACGVIELYWWLEVNGALTSLRHISINVLISACNRSRQEKAVTQNRRAVSKNLLNSRLCCTLKSMWGNLVTPLKCTAWTSGFLELGGCKLWLCCKAFFCLCLSYGEFFAFLRCLPWCYDYDCRNIPQMVLITCGFPEMSWYWKHDI